MKKIYRVDPTELIEAVAAELKKIEHIKAPVWATFCKTGTHKARPPVRDDWWFVRAASVLRRIGIKGPIGVAKLRTLYGGKKDRGYAPEKFYCASGNILRKILQQLEKSGLVKQAAIGVHKGRVVTKDGEKMLEKTAEAIFKPKPKKEPAPAATEKVEESPKAESKGAPKPTDGAKHADAKKESKPAEHHKEMKPSVPHNDGKPAEHHKEVKPTIQEKDNKPAEHQKESKPTEHQNETKPAEHPKDAMAPEHQKESKPTEHQNETKLAEHPKDAMAPEHHKESKPTEYQNETNPAEHQKESKSVEPQKEEHKKKAEAPAQGQA